MAKLRIGGAWSGVLEVELEEWTVVMLKEEVAKRSECTAAEINLICAGRVLKDGDGGQKLSQLGVKNNAKILATRVSADEGNALKEGLMAEEERSCRLSRLKAAVTALAERHSDGSLPLEDFNIELVNQSGDEVKLGSETDQRAVMMGLMLHTNAKKLIASGKYKDALEVLAMGEEAFSLCKSEVIELIDNIPILQLDTVWCYFMLQDIELLSQAGMRLSKARQGIERAHGKESSRLALLQRGRPEIALHLRMELLEGVVAYHSGQFEKSRQALTSAQTKYFQLQVPDEALSSLVGMGFKESDAKRALRINNQDVQSAVDFLVDEKAKRAQKRLDDIQRRKDIREQKRYGMTALRKPVNLLKLQELTIIGFEKELAAEALRINENDLEKALSALTNPETNTAIQIDLETRKRNRQRQKVDATIEELVSMGFPRAAVVAAVEEFGTRERALNHLLGQADLPAAGGGNASSAGSNILSNENGVEATSGVTELASGDEAVDGPSRVKIERDVEMENELTGGLQSTDAFSDYDMDVTKEGEAISVYLTMLASAGNFEKGSSSH
ncbi:uncharacterized protein LOC127795614 [Diospyros lotus]|uniref:uncharacterized protein LOC127795614 n=1 Tax=Diospyros lotus TaxID=55363 RepID=UPI0022523B1B|nr:uncharacterized protein LOC127795614 [Diospyros lotus]